MSKLLDISALGGFILFACSGWATISLILLFVGYSFFHQWIQGSQCQAKERLDGKTAIITGGTAGIGKEVARILSSRGARVVIGCRDLVKGRKVVDGIKAHNPWTDSSTSSGSFITSVTHILINNAGFYSPSFKNTVDGHEMVFQVNYLGHFLLVNLLLPLLRVSAPARIINMTSKLNSKNSTDFDDVNSEKDFQPKGSYEKSKVANALFTKELAKRLEGSGVSVYGVNPGSTNTALMKSLMPSLPGHAQTIAEILYGLSTKTPREWCADNCQLCLES
ncbi:RDH12 [Lepeophtheirus salmonis]|uniref:RDH12 n=1 Tax=Lepeophtheirus salmonis TaxID=72036 RepID=A0A7R8D4T2_LEPSM|nr:RDH12 [Lepeophtheirus salmonis]CAF3028371.1 RDH12 [Lepeophtheirus salmonis]